MCKCVRILKWNGRVKGYNTLDILTDVEVVFPPAMCQSARTVLN